MSEHVTAAPAVDPEVAVAPYALQPKDTGMVLAGRDSILSFQGMTLDEMEEALTRREQALDRLRSVAIKSTVPIDWTMFKDKDGREIGVPRDSALVNIRKWLGISTLNYRPKNAHGAAEPLVTQTDKGGVEVLVVEMWASGSCSLTGETVEDVYFAVRSDLKFVGRTEDGDKNKSPLLQDLKASCRTGLDAKIVRILSGLRKVDASTLERFGVDAGKAYKGSGYGTSDQRGAAREADGDIGELKAQLKREILRCVGGNAEQAVELLKEVTAYKTKAGKQGYFDHIDKLTQAFQFEKALEKLHAHPTWQAVMAGENGAEGGAA